VAPQVLAWLRELDRERVLVLLNAGDEPRTCELRGLPSHGHVVVGTDPERGGRVALDGLTLAALEGIVIRI
jgi:hypothetical protein